MKVKGCLAGLVISFAVIAIFIIAIRHVQSRVNPVYHGKRLVEWADEAVCVGNHTARQRAVEVLREACYREGEETRLRVYKEFITINRDGTTIYQFPEELLPFLLERFKEEDECAAMIAGGLEKCPPAQTVPQLIEILKVESDPWKQDLLICTLGRIGSSARTAVPVIRRLLPNMNGDHRRMALWALKQIDPKAQDLPDD